MTVTVRVNPGFSGTLNNAAEVRANEPELNPNNNRDEEPTVVTPLVASIAGCVYVDADDDGVVTRDEVRAYMTANKERTDDVRKEPPPDGSAERENIAVVKAILAAAGRPETLVRHVEDRPGHDRRYALNCDKLKGLGWKPARDFEAEMAETVEWYKKNEWWWRPLKERGASARKGLVQPKGR